MKKNRNESVWPWFVLAAIPIFGGLLGYFANRKKNTELADMCLLLTLVNPLLISFFSGVIGALISFENYLLIGYSLSIIGSLIISWLVVNVTHKKNFYKEFVWVEFFGLIGGLYAYFKVYEKYPKFKNNVVSAMIGIIIISLIFSYAAEAYVGYTTLPPESSIELRAVIINPPNPEENNLDIYVNERSGEYDAFAFSIGYPKDWGIYAETFDDIDIVMFTGPEMDEYHPNIILATEYLIDEYTLSEYTYYGKIAILKEYSSNGIVVVDEGFIKVSGQDAYFVEYSLIYEDLPVKQKHYNFKDGNGYIIISYTNTQNNYDYYLEDFENGVYNFKLIE